MAKWEPVVGIGGRWCATTGNPYTNEVSCGFPFHGFPVSPDSKKAFLLAFRTMVTNGVCPRSRVRSVIAVTRTGASKSHHDQRRKDADRRGRSAYRRIPFCVENFACTSRRRTLSVADQLVVHRPRLGSVRISKTNVRKGGLN